MCGAEEQQPRLKKPTQTQFRIFMISTIRIKQQKVKKELLKEKGS